MENDQVQHSKLGHFPTDWKLVKLGFLASKVGSGITPRGGSQTYLQQGIPFIRSQNVLQGSLDLSDVVYISEKQHEIMSSTHLNPSDVLLNITGASIGRSCVVPLDFKEGNVNQHVCIIRPYKDLVSYFLSSFLNSPMGQKQIDEFQAGGNRQGLNYQQIRSFTIPLPSLPEQRKIAEILSTWDEAIAASERLLAALRERKKGLMQRLLSGQVRFAGFEGEWKEKRLGDIGNYYSGLSGKTKEDFGFGKPYITYRNIFENSKIDPSKLDQVNVLEGESHNAVQKGDIFFTLSSETPDEVGMSSVLLDDLGECYLNSFCFGFRLQPEADLLPEYARFLFRSDIFRQKMFKLAQGSTRYNISKREVMKFIFELPDIYEQKKIVSILGGCEAEIELHTQQLSALQKQKKGLMQRLLTGQVRVKASETSEV